MVANAQPTEVSDDTRSGEPAVDGRLPRLRGYQQDAVTAIETALATGGRGQVWAACGTGKTVVALHAARRLCPAGLTGHPPTATPPPKPSTNNTDT